MTSRTLAGVAGGYGCAVLMTILLAKTVPADRAQALSAGMMSSFVVWVTVMIWAFAARTAFVAWLGVAIFAAVMAGLLGLAFAA